MELYFSKGACSLACHIALHESGLPHKSTPVPLDGSQKKPEFLSINPKGSVPALKMKSDQVLTEAAVILQYIADSAPDKKLIPAAGTMDRYKAQEWLNYMATEIHKMVGAYFSFQRISENAQTQADVRKFYDGKVKWQFDFLSNHLQKNDFILGSQFSVIDGYLFTLLNWCKMVKIDLSQWPTLMGYYEKVKTRPAVQSALKAEGLA